MKVTPEEFEKMLATIHETGGNPEYVIGRCPHCKEPFTYNRRMVAGHWASECPQKDSKNV